EWTAASMPRCPACREVLRVQVHDRPSRGHRAHGVLVSPTSRRRGGMTGERLRCRGCDAALGAPFLDLGPTPLANSYLKPEDLNQPEPFYPLQVYLCEACFLVQIPLVQAPESIFGDYAYFSSYSTTWLRHAEHYAATMATRLDLGSRSLVIEV